MRGRGGGLKVGRGGLKGSLYGILKERQETKDVSQSLGKKNFHRKCKMRTSVF